MPAFLQASVPVKVEAILYVSRDSAAVDFQAFWYCGRWRDEVSYQNKQTTGETKISDRFFVWKGPLTRSWISLDSSTNESYQTARSKE